MTPMFNVLPELEEPEEPDVPPEEPAHAARVIIAAPATASTAHDRGRPTVRSTSAYIWYLRHGNLLRQDTLSPMRKTRSIEYKRCPTISQGRESRVMGPEVGSIG